MAPELLATSHHQANRATDIYAAGLVLSEMFYGIPPVLGKRMGDGRLDYEGPEIGELVNEILGTMCASDPAERFKLSLYDIAELFDAMV